MKTNESRRRQGAGAQSERMPAMCAEVGGLRRDDGVHTDVLVLQHLAEKLGQRGTRLRRDEVAKRLARLGSFSVRDWRWVAWRWLRRYVGGVWVLGGRHVARPFFGAMLYAAPHRGWSNLVEGGTMVRLLVNERESAAGERRAA